MRKKTDEEIKALLDSVPVIETPGPVLQVKPPTLRDGVEDALRRAYTHTDPEPLKRMIPQNRKEARRHLRGRGPWGLASRPK